MRQLEKMRAGKDAADRQACAPPVVIRLVVEYNQLLQRLTGRRSCPTCGLIYNVYHQPPKVQGICDVDGTPLVQRRDDTEEVIAERLKAYEQLTLPLVDYYGSRGRLIEVNGDQPVEAVAGTNIQRTRECQSSVSRSSEIDKMRRSGRIVRQVLEAAKETGCSGRFHHGPGAGGRTQDPGLGRQAGV